MPFGAIFHLSLVRIMGGAMTSFARLNGPPAGYRVPLRPDRLPGRRSTILQLVERVGHSAGRPSTSAWGLRGLC